ncbi:MAG: hypothetical protein M3R49_08365 [Chloroflexota bacterium]|nr:hypothetical protein [Chloroflexota bacterium]
MTMEPNHHPDEERLAAFAGGEPDVELRLHVRDCARCGSIVDELTMLRAALAELPDLAPSRPLRLLPEVAEPQPSAAERLAGWTRRAFMPLLAAGFGLAIVGSLGTVGSIFNMGSAGAGPAGAPLERDFSAPSASADTVHGAAAAPGESARTSLGADSASSGPKAAASASSSPEPALAAFQTPPAATPRPLWPMVLFAGLALIVATLLLRWIVQPRAG